MSILRTNLKIGAVGIAAFAVWAAPAAAMQQGGEETFVNLGRWSVVQDDTARACELRLTAHPQVVLRYRMADGRASVIALQRKSGRFFTGMVGDVVWAFDNARFAGFEDNNSYSLSAGARDVEAGFRSAKTLSVVHGGQQVAQIDLKTSSAGFRLLKQCSEQWRYIPWYRRLASARYRDLEAPSTRALPRANRSPSTSSSARPAIPTGSVAPRIEAPTQSTPLAARPINPIGWIKSNDSLPWPSRGFREGQGVLGYTLLVDENGRAEDCEIDRSTGSRRFDKQACRLLVERARFEPARGSNGNAVEGRYSASVRFAGE